ncbi:MAG TPA: RNA polymerase sigma factor [Frankiaceae bacterium]|nr:RNA polymerase sigma factor [Frankiaceae bacterium]
MTTQPELPEVAALPARPALYVAPPPVESDVNFDGFVRAYEARLRRLVLRRIGDLGDAEEITQETLLRAYQHRASFGTEDELMAWSTVVAQRLVIDRVRVRGRSIAVPDVPESARVGRDTAEIVVARHEARAALESLEAIPTRQAAILWAREVEGLHYEEIAERFGITEPAVRSLLHRGRKALRKEFKDRTGSLPLNGLVPFAPWLLALKAAGKVRGAAKTVTKSSVTAAAALSISALVATTGLGPFGGAHDTRTTAPVSVDADDRSAAAGRAVGEAGEAVQRRTATAARTPAVAPTDTAPGGRPLTFQACIPGMTDKCIRGGEVQFGEKGGYLQVGPDLPENPADLANIVIQDERLDCRAVPTTAVSRCTQYSDPAPLTQIGVAKPAPEGAVR